MQLSPSSPFVAKLLINSRLQSVFPFHFLPVISPQGLTFLQASTLQRMTPPEIRSGLYYWCSGTCESSLDPWPRCITSYGWFLPPDALFLLPHSTTLIPALPRAFLCWLAPIYLTCKCWNSSSCVSLYQSSSLSKCPLHSPGSHCHLCADDPQTETKTLLWCPLLPRAVYPDSSSECLTLPSTAI